MCLKEGALLEEPNLVSFYPGCQAKGSETTEDVLQGCQHLLKILKLVMQTWCSKNFFEIRKKTELLTKVEGIIKGEYNIVTRVSN